MVQSRGPITPSSVSRMMKRLSRGAGLIAGAVLLVAPLAGAQTPSARAVINDSHFHLTNYIQRGPDIHEFLKLMGDSVGRVAIFGIPLQQEWLEGVTGEQAPTYYLHSDAPLYYYSFTDAYIASQYLSLTPAERARFDPMITGFDPRDMYAVDHIKRVLRTFPGVFSGIGEFSVHKEFVSSQVSPGPASLLDPALDSILNFAGEAGLVVILHEDMDVPFASGDAAPAYLADTKALLRRHPNTTVIWAHTGMGRVVRAVKNHGAVLESMLSDSTYRNLYFDISWDVVAKYLMETSEGSRNTIALINRYPDRFLFGTDAVAPSSADAYLSTYRIYAPLWKGLSPEARARVLTGNYERLFDEARRKVRAWEARDATMRNADRH